VYTAPRLHVTLHVPVFPILLPDLPQKVTWDALVLVSIIK